MKNALTLAESCIGKKKKKPKKPQNDTGAEVAGERKYTFEKFLNLG